MTRSAELANRDRKGADGRMTQPPHPKPRQLTVTARERGPFPPGREGDREASGLFLYLNANKRGVALDLREAEDRALFLGLVGDADVLLTNLRPGEADPLGMGYDELSARFPGLVYTS